MSKQLWTAEIRMGTSWSTINWIGGPWNSFIKALGALQKHGPFLYPIRLRKYEPTKATNNLQKIVNKKTSEEQ